MKAKKQNTEKGKMLEIKNKQKLEARQATVFTFNRLHQLFKKHR